MRQARIRSAAADEAIQILEEATQDNHYHACSSIVACVDLLEDNGHQDAEKHHTMKYNVHYVDANHNQKRENGVSLYQVMKKANQ